MTLAKKYLTELRKRRESVLAVGKGEKAERRHNEGRLTARERLDALFAPDTFQEIGMHIRHRATAFGMADKEMPADGVIVGHGLVNNLTVAAFSQDFAVAAGTLGSQHAEKIVKAQHFAMRTGVPIVALQDSGGARIQEGVDALSGYGKVFYHNVLLSGVVPQIAVIMGPCAGGASYSPALMDFIIMTRQHAQMFITGPEVIKAVTGRAVTMDEVGSAAVHAQVAGNVHFVAEDDREALLLVKRLLGFLPANNTEDPPHRVSEDIALGRDEGIYELIPGQTNEPMDAREIIQHIVDPGEFLEIHREFAGNIIVGLARIYGVVVGLIANQPTVKAGALDIDASDKAARFVRFCNVFNIPLVTLVDVPGFQPGVEQERGGIIRHGAKLLYAYASATVPKLTVILRKAYGGSYLAMCSQEMGADMVYAWPTAEIAVMGAEGAVNLLYRKELKAADDRRARAKELAEEYRAEFASPYLSAARGYVTDVIDPAETRSVLGLSLVKLLSKRELRPAKKHGNIPL